jgi:hypothetical protein
LKHGDARVLRRNTPHSSCVVGRNNQTRSSTGSTFDPWSNEVPTGKQLENSVMKHDKRIGRAPRMCLIDLSLAGFSARAAKPTLFSQRSRTLLDDISASSSQTTQVSASNQSGTSVSRRDRSRKVRFNPVGVYEIRTHSRSNMSKEEVSAYWYSSDEKARCKEQAQKMANSFIADKSTNRNMEAIESAFHALKTISRNVHVENDIGDTITSMTVIDDMLQNTKHITSAPECQQTIQFAYDALQRWFDQSSHFGDDDMLGLERFVTKKIIRDSFTIRKSVIHLHHEIKMKPSTPDNNDERCVEDVLALFSHKQTLPHRLFSRFLGDVIHLETIANQ